MVSDSRQDVTSAFTAKDVALHDKNSLAPAFSAQHLQAISNAISNNFAPQFTIKSQQTKATTTLSANELLEISNAVSLTCRPILETPKLMLLPVDPQHVYVYWNLPELKSQLREAKNTAAKPALRLFVETENSDSLHDTTWFDVDLDRTSQQQQITLPPMGNAYAYSASIGLLGADQQFIATRNSNHIQIPRLSFSNGSVEPLPHQQSLLLDSKPLPSTFYSSSKRGNASGKGYQLL